MWCTAFTLALEGFQVYGAVMSSHVSVHAAGGLTSLFAVLLAGGRHVFPSRFNAEVMLEDLDRHQVEL